jgi:uncharacterized membrane-anchored protein YitT (DUF2179 family)
MSVPFYRLFAPIVRDAFYIIPGVVLAAFGLESFLLPNAFIDGGVTGIALLIAETTGLPLSILLFVISIPFLILGRFVVGRQFAWKTTAAIAMLATMLALFQFPELTDDKVLVAIFGGFFLGTGIGLSIRGGSVLDGTEILAIFLSRKWGLKISDLIVFINIFIFLAAAYLLSIESALYSMLTYIVASKAMDFVVDGIEEYTGITIISEESEAIRKTITEEMGRGVTIYQGKGGYGHQETRKNFDILYTVITRLEIRKLTLAIEDIDPDAFVVMNSINDTRGGMIKRRPLA